MKQWFHRAGVALVITASIAAFWSQSVTAQRPAAAPAASGGGLRRDEAVHRRPVGELVIAIGRAVEPGVVRDDQIGLIKALNLRLRISQTEITSIKRMLMRKKILLPES